MKFFIILFIFLFLGALLIISNNNISFSNEDQGKEFVSLWFNWFSELFKNVKSVTGYAIGYDWMP